MPNADSLTELIKEKFQVKKEDETQNLFSTYTSGDSIVQQAEKLIDIDSKKLIRFGTNFQIPEQDQLEPNFKVKFNNFLVEPLLREGSLLLERCLEQRDQYETLRRNSFEANIQIDELLRLNEITEREDKENYDIPSQIASFEENAVNEENKQIEQVLQKISERNKYFYDTKDDLGTYQARLANPNDSSKVMNEAKASIGVLTERDVRTLQIQEAEQFGLKKSDDEKSKAAAQNTALKKSLTKFQRERNEISRLNALRRAEQLTKTGGVLNFSEQMKPIAERLKNDLTSAWLRLSAAVIGLGDIYQYPTPNFPKLSSDNSFNFDDLVTWTQYTNVWLASFLENQQIVTRSFSLRQLTEEIGSNFDNSANYGKWRFKLKEDHFYNSRFVRLRAFSIQIDSGHLLGNWNVSIAPPRKAIIRQEGGLKNLIQEHIKTLYLGRVNERSYAVIPEPSVTSKFYNASPIGEDNAEGEWEIQILGNSTSNIPSSAIHDIDIHLTVALL